MHIQIRRAKSYALVIGAFVAAFVAIGMAMYLSNNYPQVGHVQSISAANTPLNPNGYCYSFQNGCSNYMKVGNDSPYYTTGQYLDAKPPT